MEKLVVSEYFMWGLAIPIALVLFLLIPVMIVFITGRKSGFSFVSSIIHLVVAAIIGILGYLTYTYVPDLILPHIDKYFEEKAQAEAEHKALIAARKQLARRNIAILENENWWLHVKAQNSTWKLIGKVKFKFFTGDRIAFKVKSLKDTTKSIGYFDWTSGIGGTWDFGSRKLSGSWNGLTVEKEMLHTTIHNKDKLSIALEIRESRTR